MVFEVLVICSFEIKVSENPSVLNKDGSVVQILDLNPDVSGSIPGISVQTPPYSKNAVLKLDVYNFENDDKLYRRPPNLARTKLINE